MILLGWDAPLFFANAEYFRQCVTDAIARSNTAVRRVVISAEPITSIDVTAADALADLRNSLAANGIELCFAELKDPVKDEFKRFALFAQIGEQSFFATNEAAVSDYLLAARQQ